MRFSVSVPVLSTHNVEVAPKASSAESRRVRTPVFASRRAPSAGKTASTTPYSSGKSAISDFRPVQFFGNRASLLEVSIKTGRTHQIRVHAAYAGHPVAGDAKYGDAEANAALGKFGLSRMFLHASSVSFEWPRGGTVSLSAPLPPDLAAVIDALASAPRTRGVRGPRVPRRGGRSPAR